MLRQGSACARGGGGIRGARDALIFLGGMRCEYIWETLCCRRVVPCSLALEGALRSGIHCGGVFAQRSYGVYPGNTPAHHPPTEACMIHSKQHRGCRIQDPGTRGYRGWKTADFSHSAGTAHSAPPVDTLCMCLRSIDETCKKNWETVDTTKKEGGHILSGRPAHSIPTSRPAYAQGLHWP